MRARAVIGASFGDEGKGLTVDYLCAKEGAGVVVRFNGGAQAGHTVVLPTGERHVFHHLGSGTLAGVPTFLSQYFICNPVLYAREIAELGSVSARVYAHQDSRVTTFADMLANQSDERSRGEDRHGSCGVGVHRTMLRHEAIPLTMGDLWWRYANLEETLALICAHYGLGSLDQHADYADEFMKAANRMVSVAGVMPATIKQFQDPVFEGAQGLLLDQDAEFFPHVTHSHTGLRNVRALCSEGGIRSIDAYYVSRTYLTRHGAGPLPGEDPVLSFFDATNIEHPYQGTLRFAPLDGEAMLARCQEDAIRYDARGFRLVMTHCDQLDPPIKADFYSYGPTRDDVTERLKERRA